MVPVVLLAVTLPASVSAATSGAAGTPAGFYDAGWRQDGATPGRSGYQPVTPHLDPAAAVHLQERWTAPVTHSADQIGGAVVVDGTLFRAAGGGVDAGLLGEPAAGHGQIRRYDAVTGADLGPIVDLPGWQLLQLAAPVGHLVVESQAVDPSSRELLRRRLSAYRPDGRPEWQVPLPDDVSGGFTLAGHLVLRSAGATLTAYRVSDGTVAWTAALGAEPGFQPPVADAGVALQSVEAGTGSTLVAFDLASGAPKWRKVVSGPRVIAAGGVTYTSGPLGVCAFAVADGSQRWCDRGTLRDPQYATVSDRLLMVLDGHGKAAAFGLADGKPSWTRDWGAPGSEVATSYWSPVNGGGVLYGVVYQFSVRDGVSTHRTELLAFDAASGALLTRVPLAFDSLHGAEPLLLSGDHVYFAALEKLFALG